MSSGRDPRPPRDTPSSDTPTLVERLRERAKQMDVIASPEAARAFGYGPEKVAWHAETANEIREAAARIAELERAAPRRMTQEEIELDQPTEGGSK